jgi:hypothetical protein
MVSIYIAIIIPSEPLPIPLHYKLTYICHAFTANTSTIDLKRVIDGELPQNLKGLLVFEDFNPKLALALAKLPDVWGNSDAIRIIDPELGAAFASKSLDLERLSVSYMTDAEHFFQACQQSLETYGKS